MSSFRLESAKTGFTRFTRGHFSEWIQKDAGGEGVLYAAKHDIHGNVMVKVFKSPDKYSEQEVKTLIRVICHQNIVRLLGTYYVEDGTDAMRRGYVMEFMANGSLHTVIHDLSKQYDDNQVYSWIQQAGRGIAYLHSQNIIHRDVNTSNMLLGETIGVLKISDFGLAKPDATTTEKNTCFMGTMLYMAPEVINDQGVNSAADVYSLAISTWEMFHRKNPFYEYASLPRYRLCDMIINGTRPKIELEMKEEIKNLILKSLQAQSKLRPKAKDFTAIAVKFGSQTNVSPDDDNNNNAGQRLANKSTPPSRPLSSEIQHSFDSELTLLIGGYNVIAFEHNTKTWKVLDVEIKDYCSGAVVLGEELYAFLGENWHKSWFKLNSENRSWIKLTDIPNGQSPIFFESVAYRSKIYVAVYNTETTRHENTVVAYDPVANFWSEMAPIKDNMEIKGITVFNNKLFIFGIFHIHCSNSRMEAGYYHIVKNEWMYLILDAPIKSIYSPLRYKNELLFFDNPDVYASNLAEGTPWRTLPRLKCWRKDAFVFTCGNLLIVAGGNKELGDKKLDPRCSDKVESFDGMTWTEMPRMPFGLSASTTVTATGDLAKQLLKWSC